MRRGSATVHAAAALAVFAFVSAWTSAKGQDAPPPSPSDFFEFTDLGDGRIRAHGSFTASGGITGVVDSMRTQFDAAARDYCGGDYEDVVESLCTAHYLDRAETFSDYPVCFIATMRCVEQGAEE